MNAPLSDRVRKILSNPLEANQFMQAVITGSKSSYQHPIEIEGKKFTFKKVENSSST
jgi:hypothetical protein